MCTVCRNSGYSPKVTMLKHHVVYSCTCFDYGNLANYYFHSGQLDYVHSDVCVVAYCFCLLLQLLDKGLNHLTWRSKDLNDFIEAASQLVCTDVHVNLDIVQSNSREIADSALSWCKGT